MGQVWVIMGVSGCGKTTVGRLLAQHLNGAFFDGDDDHPPANIAKMSQGTPLTDADRWPWLDRIAARIENTLASPESKAVIACSALKRVYRDRLRRGAITRPGVKFVFLQGSEELLRQRMQQRASHFMSPAMLRSQLQTLEEPGDDECVLRVSVAMPVEAVVAQILEHARQPWQ